jgi:uracil-DNA glycosylase
MLPQDWNQILAHETQKAYFPALMDFIEGEYAAHTVYPPKGQIFNAFAHTSHAGARVVILGQDPYHGPGQAHGLSFSVNPHIKIPPSLRNIFKELETDSGVPFPAHGCLDAWARQGVLLLNATLTVRAGQPNSHRGKGWEIFTDAVIRSLNEKTAPVAFLLWGKPAQKKAALITNERHLVLQSAHPSPLARGAFFGCRHFSQTGAFLEKHYGAGINWALA